MSASPPGLGPDAFPDDPLVTVVVVNYNGRRFLPELLESLSGQSFSRFDTWVVDNASQDDSLEYLRRRHPGVRVLAQKLNLGFSKAVNLAAWESKREFLAVLNTDMKLDPDWLQELVRVLQAEPAAAAAASKMRLYGSPQRLNGVGGCMNLLGFTWDRGMMEEDCGQYDRSAEVLFASAGAALFRREAFVEAGGFDERFFMYHEDVDLCWRFWILGYRVVTAPRAMVWHHFGGSTKESQGMLWRELIGERNNLRSLLKNYQLYNLPRVLLQTLLLPYKPRRKWQQIRGMLWNLSCLGDTLRQRRRIQRLRRKRDAELRYLIVQMRDVPFRL